MIDSLMDSLVLDIAAEPGMAGKHAVRVVPRGRKHRADIAQF